MSDKKLSYDINVKKIDKEDYEYIQKSNIPITTFVRLAIKEKIARDK